VLHDNLKDARPGPFISCWKPPNHGPVATRLQFRLSAALLVLADLLPPEAPRDAATAGPGLFRGL